jgi:hypothetical protein
MENNTEKFELVQRQAKALSLSTMIPKDYQNNIPNTLVALEMDTAFRRITFNGYAEPTYNSWPPILEQHVYYCSFK